MELMEMFSKLQDSKSSEETYVLYSLIEDTIGKAKDALKEKFASEEPRSVSFPELGKTFNIMEIKKSVLHAEEIKAQMTDTEIRTVYKPTDKDLQLLKRDDLREMKDVTLQKQVRVVSLSS